MTAPAPRTGCRVLDKDGDDETPGPWDDGGMPEGLARTRARILAEFLPDWSPYRVVDADGVTLHTIHAPEAK